MKKIFLVIATFSLYLQATAQDIGHKSYLYFNNNNGFEGKIQSIPEAGKISFSINSGGIRTYQKDRLLIAFNEFGKYLIVSDIPNSPEESKAVLQDFYLPIQSFSKHDIIFKAIPFEIIPCKISYIKDAINYRTLDSTSGSVNRENVLAFIRTDGTHEIIRDITEVAPILNTNKEQFNNLFLGNNEKPNTPIKPTNTPILVQKPANNTITETPAAPKVAPNKPKLTSEEKVKYSKQSVDNILVFKDYLAIIGDKKKSLVEKKEASKSAMELFSPGATIEVTSKNKSGSKKLPVETYLRNLSNLNYSSIEIEYANLKFVTELTQATDGSYYGTVSGEQTFVGFDANGKQLYTDVVDKNYKVKVESFKAVQSGVAEIKWKVLLGDVSLSQ